MTMNKLTTLLIVTAVAASGIFLATRLHKTIQTQVPSARIVSLYNDFKVKFGKLRASPDEDNFRLRVFEKNVAYIEEANKNALGYSLAINDFADMEPEEVKAQYFGLGKISVADILKWFTDEKEEEVKKEEVQVPEQTIDWSQDMNPIEHQRGCASCYAFSTVAPLELNHFKKTGQKIRLSKQELVDCTEEHGNTGCRGGWMHQSYDYILSNKGKGMSTESSYPYQASQMRACKIKTEVVKNLLTSYRQIPCDTPSEIAKHLQTTVVPSAIDVSGLMFYEKGIFAGKCPTSINHAVVIVGMGEENGVKYWKVRNSWGKQWGEKGYLRIKREAKDGDMGKCGITVYNVVPQ